jgi:hypothetical protein
MFTDPDSFIPIKDAPKHIPGRPNLATVYRWFQRGVRGVKLQTVCVGGRRFVARTALDEFISATTAAASGRAGARCQTRRTRA